jgi:hypothetical protein
MFSFAIAMSLLLMMVLWSMVYGLWGLFQPSYADEQDEYHHNDGDNDKVQFKYPKVGVVGQSTPQRPNDSEWTPNKLHLENAAGRKFKRFFNKKGNRNSWMNESMNEEDCSAALKARMAYDRKSR